MAGARRFQFFYYKRLTLKIDRTEIMADSQIIFFSKPAK